MLLQDSTRDSQAGIGEAHYTPIRASSLLMCACWLKPQSVLKAHDIFGNLLGLVNLVMLTDLPLAQRAADTAPTALHLQPYSSNGASSRRVWSMANPVQWWVAAHKHKAEAIWCCCASRSCGMTSPMLLVAWKSHKPRKSSCCAWSLSYVHLSSSREQKCQHDLQRENPTLTG